MVRRHASPADFELVGMSSDPTPGDPELIRAVQQRYSDIGDAAEKALNVLRKGGAVESGRGSAMDKLAEMIGDDLPDKLRKTATSYQEAARAYREYIPRLEDAQSTLDQAVDRAQEAAPKANQALPAPLPPDATPEAQASARSTEDAIEAGRAQLSAARSLAEQARSMRETAARQASEVLDRAAGEAIPERNIFQKIADFFKEFPFVEILLGILIAIVAVFFPVVGFLLGAALFAVTTLPAILAGDFELADLLLALVSILPLGGALARGARIVDDVARLRNGAGRLFGGLRGADDLPPGATRGNGSINDLRDSLDDARPVGPAGQVVRGAGEEAIQAIGEGLAAQAVSGEELSVGAVVGGALAGGIAGGAGRRGRSGDDAPPSLPGSPRPGETDRSGAGSPADEPAQEGFGSVPSEADRSGFGSRPEEPAREGIGSAPAEAGRSGLGARPDEPAREGFGSAPGESGRGELGSRPEEPGREGIGSAPAEAGRSGLGARPDEPAREGFGSAPGDSGRGEFGSRPEESARDGLGSAPAEAGGSGFGPKPAEPEQGGSSAGPGESVQGGSGSGTEESDRSGSGGRPQESDRGGSAPAPSPVAPEAPSDSDRGGGESSPQSPAPSPAEPAGGGASFGSDQGGAASPPESPAASPSEPAGGGSAPEPENPATSPGELSGGGGEVAPEGPATSSDPSAANPPAADLPQNGLSQNGLDSEGLSPGRLTDDNRTPLEQLDLRLIPDRLEREGDTRFFRDTVTQQRLEVHQADGLLETFNVVGTNERVFFDAGDGPGQGRFLQDTSEAAPASFENTSPRTFPKPADHFVVRGFEETGDLTRITDLDALRGVGDNQRPVLVRMDQLTDDVLRGRDSVDPPRVEHVSREIANGEAVEPIGLRADADGRFTIVGGNHRIAAVREAGLDFIPVVLKP
ncbi:putative T7SS-secreted protein [Kineosporia babensis]|uniref:ParB N-terminal domain-containing protein n=1 Tax=Kineosporia babensis TaxID=499548 RepID=A0A9X1NJ90_9ACTN|nr:ParB N-terminal domain-containing protein [Kineosporia babensis]MCD5314731.1 ParB N-terminal domain-containing protein [Kineosporia babensis]